MPTRYKIKRQLVGGFLLLNLVLISIIVTGMFQLQQVTDHLDQLAFNTNVKLQLASDMHESVHIRRNSLYRFVETLDQFRRVEEWETFNEAASVYLATRQQLSELLTSQTERNLLNDLDKLTLKGQPLQLKVIDLVYEGYLDEASLVLFDEAKPVQSQVIEQIGHLLGQFETDKDRLVEEAHDTHQQALYVMAILGVIAIILSITIALVVTRNVSQHIRESQLQQRKYRALFESSLDAIFLWHDWKLIQSNDAARRMFRIEDHAESSLTLLDLLPKHQANGDGPAEVLQELFEHTSEYDLYYCEMQRRDGSRFPVDIRLSHVQLDDAKVVQMVIRDKSKPVEDVQL